MLLFSLGLARRWQRPTTLGRKRGSDNAPDVNASTAAEEEIGIAGAILKRLTRHPDERGFFLELIRFTDPFFAEGFAQLSHSKMFPEVAKAWHIHRPRSTGGMCPSAR